MARSAENDTDTRVLTETAQAPHNAVKAEKLSVFIGSRCLLADAELTLPEQGQAVQVETPCGGVKTIRSGTAYGLVGPNGCGKSTLLHLLEQKKIPVPATWDAFLVGQHLPRASGAGALAEVLAADAGRKRLLELQAAVEDEVRGLAEADADAFAEANDRLLQIRCELSKWEGSEQEVIDILVNLGFRKCEAKSKAVRNAAPTISTPAEQLSGGWRMKVELAKALWLKPKLLLLDEPTNHLDFLASQWLTDKLEQYPHTAVVVSHDVSVLHKVCREILWIKDHKIESLPRDVVSQDDLLRMQRTRPLKFQFAVPLGEDPVAHGLSLHDIHFSYASGGSSSSRKQSQRFHVKGDVRFSGRSRAVLLGRNGSGKSTFLDICVGNLIPYQGTVDRTDGLKIGHYSQLTDDLDRQSELHAAQYLLKECRDALAARISSTRGSRMHASLAKAEGEAQEARPTNPRKAAANDKRLLEVARGVLSHFGFEGDVAVSVPVDRLSGGQKACLKFAVLSLRPAHLLLLDEPTNHLDAEASKALAEGLANFQGGIVAVTHDDLLIYRLIHCNWNSSELILCQDGRLRREKNFCAHCLKSLRDEVRRAEEAEKAAGRQDSLPEWEETLSAKPVATPGEVRAVKLPPWLQVRSRRREKPSEVQRVTASKIKTEVAPPGSVDGQPLKDPEAEIPRVVDILVSSCLQSPAQLSSNASTRTSSPAAVQTETWKDSASEEDDCHAVEAAGSVGGPRSRHSRLHRDLKNLNKAVAKWLGQEERGELARDELVAKIKQSAAAQQLRFLHGDDFEEEGFVGEVLGRSEKAGSRQRTQTSTPAALEVVQAGPHSA